jgi:hypothetical protein
MIPIDHRSLSPKYTPFYYHVVYATDWSGTVQRVREELSELCKKSSLNPHRLINSLSLLPRRGSARVYFRHKDGSVRPIACISDRSDLIYISERIYNTYLVDSLL